MRRIWWLALVVACGCQFEKSEGRKGQGAARPVPEAPAKTQTPAPALDQHVTPWRPRLQDAKFFSRPADSWTHNDLQLANYALDVQVAEGVATTTLDVSVTNPTSAQAEAVIELPIPPGAAVTGATLWVGDKPMVGIMLGSAKARQVYDEVVGRRRDPLLVAWSAADMVSLSIFPLEAKQTRRFKVTWVEPAVSNRHWVPAFYDQSKEVGGPSAIAVNGKPATRDGQWVEIPKSQPASGGDWRLVPQTTMTPTSVAIIVDTSGELGAMRGPQWRSIEGFLHEFKGRAKTTVVAADWLIAELGAGRTVEDFDTAREQFMTIRSAGLFDYEHAVAKVTERVGRGGAIAVFSHRLPNSYPVADRFDTPVFWVNMNGADAHPAIVDRSGGTVVPDGPALARTIHPVLSPSEPGFDWLPMTTATGHVVWLGSRTGNEAAPDTKPSPVEALFYKAMLRRAQIPLNKIVSPRTSILVLESEAHYKKHGIKDSKGEIVRTEEETKSKGITGLLKDSDPSPQGFGTGGLGTGGGGTGWGTIGIGRYGTIGRGSGTGAGYGIGVGRLSGRRSSPPRIRIGRAMVEGNLDKNIVRRYIRRRLPRIRYCYEKELLRHEELQGTATAEFVISAEGKVATAKVGLDHPNGKATSACIEKAIKSIIFPKPRGGGIIRVKYPFVLSPGPASLWSKARKLIDEGAPGFGRKVGSLFGKTDIGDDRVALAWWLAENEMRSYATPPSGYVTVAKLLRGAQPKSATNENDARRILSEGARRYPDVVGEVFKQWGYLGDAERAAHTARAGTMGTLGWGTFR